MKVRIVKTCFEGKDVFYPQYEFLGNWFGIAMDKCLEICGVYAPSYKQAEKAIKEYVSRLSKENQPTDSANWEPVKEWEENLD